MSSPAFKRQRLSSPTYEAEFEDFNSDDLLELDRIEVTLSQIQRQQPASSSSSQRIPQSSQAISPNSKKRRLRAITDALQDSGDKGISGFSDPVSEKRAGYGSTGFKSVAAISDRSHNNHDAESSSSQSEHPPEKDFTDWFKPATAPDAPLLGFQAVSKCLKLSSDNSNVELNSENKELSGLESAANAQAIALEPSKAALERWSKKLEDWSAEDETWVKEVTTTQAPLKRASGADSSRPPLTSMLNSPVVHRSPQPRSFSTPLLNRNAVHRPRGFKSPLLPQQASRIDNSREASPLKGNIGVAQTPRTHPPTSASVTGFETPDHHFRAFSDTSLQFSTPVRPSARNRPNSVIRRPPRPSFATPFKKGMGPGEPGRAALENLEQPKKMEPVPTLEPPVAQLKVAKSGKITLEGSGLRPHRYSSEELENMGLNIAELKLITPQTAPFYVFHTPASHVSSQASGSSSASLGPAEALAHLHKTGRMATREWVDNHWALILWKLAGLAALDPERESTPSRRWCWRVVMEQLEKRHDKEFGKGARPALRLITTGDAPAASPLVLVVTAVLFSQEQLLGKNGKVVRDASAEIEVSDGWYRLRALLDAPLSHAAVRGIIKPGRKLAVAGAKLENEKKDPCEILEAYNSCTLLLSGNGSHLAPWHAKLGFHSEPFIATLGSLTPDGGSVPSADFIIEKVHPIAFFEFLPGSKLGEKKREGPRGEAEEAAIEDAWKKRREAAESKVREEIGARWARWDGLAERLERAEGGKFSASADDMPPDHIEDLFDELDALPSGEVGPFIRQLGVDECGWLARYLRRRSEKDKENAAEEVECEMNHLCPPREVRNFRIVQVRDARTLRRPANRIAHLCIWDVLSLCVSEGGKAGAIELGQRFLMTNLVPMQQSCWMGRAKDDMVYLSTTRNSRFYRLK
ncbi:hypothetical protein ACEPAF_4152 [Sanghuangporus sanghuang]